MLFVFKTLSSFIMFTFGRVNNMSFLSKVVIRNVARFNISVTRHEMQLPRSQCANLFRDLSTYKTCDGFLQKQKESFQNTQGDRDLNVFVKTAMLAGLLGAFQREDEQSDGESNIINMIKLAELSKMKGEGGKSERLLHVALRSAQDLNHVRAQRYIIDLLANNAYDDGDFQKAEKLFQNLISQLLAEGYAQDDNAIIHISAKLASLYGLAHEDEKAVEGFKFCVDKLKKKIDDGADDVDTIALYGLSLHWFGEYFFTRERFSEALSFFEKSHDISIRIHGPDHGQSLLLLNNMAAACNATGRFDKAIQHLLEAIEQAQKHPDENREDLPCYYINLANVYLQEIYLNHANKEALLDKAKQYCDIGLSLARNSGSSEALREAVECKEAVEKVKI